MRTSTHLRTGAARTRPTAIIILTFLAAIAVGAAVLYRIGAPRRSDLPAPHPIAEDGSATARSLTTQPIATQPVAIQPITFNRDIAPVFFDECAQCHRTGGPAPFNLLTYEDARHHAKQIARVTAAKLMPPWLPDPGCGDFVGERRLTAAQIANIQRWAEGGTPEGNAADLPQRPTWSNDWELGPPDLIVTPPKAYELPAAGNGLYRNFVFSIPTDAPRYVRAVELRCDNPRVVHHTFLMVDRGGASRIRSEHGGGTGFGGMDAGQDVYTPTGFNLSWQPGKPPCLQTESTPWLLPGHTDVVLQMHLRPSGKPESLRPQLGFYFTDKPSLTPSLLYGLHLRSTAIDIAPGLTDFAITSHYLLPTDVDVLMVSAHAHSIGKQFRGWAVLPDGHEIPLLCISDWSFELQDVFTCRVPIALPKGSTIRMRWTYDNSAANPHNPNSPPARIFYGDDYADEMGEFWVQARVRAPADLDALAADFTQRYLVPDAIDRLQNLIHRHPDDAALHAELALGMRRIGRADEMNRELQTSLKLDPECPRARLLIAQLLFEKGNYPGAIEQYRRALKGDPDNAAAEADLGLALGIVNKLPEAVDHLIASLKLNPGDALTHTNLGRIYAVQGNLPGARAELETALRLDPAQSLAWETLKAMPKP